MGSNIVLFATKRVGIEVFRFLLSNNYPICCVVSNELEIVEFAKDSNIPCCPFGDVENFLDTLESFSWLINAWSPHYIKKEILDKFEHRLNIHPSYAPYTLGNDNAAWAIMEEVENGEIIAGVSLLEMTEKIDEGGIWARSKVDVSFPIKGYELQKLLIDECIILFCEKFSDIYSGKVEVMYLSPISKHTRKETNAKKILKSSDMLSVYEVVNNILANDFSPNYTSILEHKNQKYKITINLEKIND
ncbi:formyltransferase family protein [Helicobacter sp. WB40]|uniref:formyltransferase family protein n=1 Tax=Helicobacter sp. WB40 TaxID=3004130 RepID=UPI0022EBF208|nr:formyltransferase family protein [Helicobacter sp. WB40]MDA3967439.1 hypothetical protein [Helicobacter sp. WB40]